MVPPNETEMLFTLITVWNIELLAKIRETHRITEREMVITQDYAIVTPVVQTYHWGSSIQIPSGVHPGLQSCAGT